MYDYYLGGKDNYPADRAAAERIIAMMPGGVVRTSAIQNRKFLMRVVRHLTEDLGIRQFLDIGTGLPTMNSVHQVAQVSGPGSRVVYVDHDPIVLAHSRNLLHGDDNATVIRQDVRDPAGILADPELRAMLDLSQPVAVLLVAVLHFIADADDPQRLVRTLMDPMPAGSYLVISHFTADSYAQADVAAQEYDNANSALHSRHRSEVGQFFAGYELSSPGSVVWTPQWRRPVDEPEDDPEVAANPGRSLFWCGVGRKVGPGRPEALPPVAAAQGFPTLGLPALGLPALGVPAIGVPAQGRPAGGFDPESAAPQAPLRSDIPNVARIYDYILGGKDNYPVDRAAAERVVSAMPEGVLQALALENRGFLMRAVRYLGQDAGISQFLDIGAGLPTMNSVHQVAQVIAPDSRVVYVDNDPVVLAHSRDLLHGDDRATVIRADLRDTAGILAAPELRAMLDLGRPVGVLLLAILHFIPDAQDPYGIVRALMDALPSGSHLVISHFTPDSHERQAAEITEVYENSSAPMYSRSRAQVAEFFAGLDLAEPGLVWAPQWRQPADGPVADPRMAADPGLSMSWCGVAGKR
jgi:S-adenosyl methyltransferase/GLTT repeat (6 copies)